ncbi:MAG: ABC transporter substrate-binding protein [Alphaproteobacteria bacterium]|nr:ABC transporter substrate-binding protein [Alphaproteobacteria bacterium]
MNVSAKLVLAGILLAGMAGPAQSQGKYKIVFNLSWLPQGSTSGVVVAIDKGYYSAEGLDVSAVRGYGGLRTVNEIDQGMFEFGYGNPDGVILNRSKGGKTRMIGAINATNPGGVCFVESRINPKSVKELKGMTLGAAAGTPVTTTFPALLSLNGLTSDHVKIVQLQGSVIYPALVNGTIDIYECWLGSGKPILEHQARAAGVKIGFLSYEDMGLQNIGSGVAVTDETVAKRPDVVRKFLKATYRGYEDMIKNPNEGADITKKMFPESDRAVVYDQIIDINKLIKGPGVDEHGLGYIDPTRAKNTFDFVSRTMKVENVKAEDTFTNQFIEK